MPLVERIRRDHPLLLTENSVASPFLGLTAIAVPVPQHSNMECLCLNYVADLIVYSLEIAPAEHSTVAEL